VLPVAINVIDLAISDVKTVPESCGRQGITVTATGGTGLQYSLNGGAFQTSPTFTNLTGGAYTVAVKDAGGCQTTKPVTLTGANPLKFDKVTVTQPGCGSATGRVDVSASGGSGQLSCAIDNQPAFNVGATPVPVSVAPGNYTLTLKDQSGCTQTQAVSVSAAAPAPVIASVGVTSTSCGQDNGRLAMVVTGGRPPLGYSTDGTTFQPGATFANLKSGAYTVSVRDADGCSVSQAASIGGSAGPRIEQVLVTPATCGLTDGTLQIRATASPGLSYSRDGSTFQAAPDFVACAPGSYTALVRDGAGCVAQYAVILRETCGDIVYLPSAFSPNGDGKNDALVIRFPGKSLSVKSFQVFNRWGTLVFALDAATIRPGDALWDAQNLSPQQRTGTYTYTFAVELADGQPFTYRGTITLMN
jgi:gliding motility-associated-like protein